MAMRMIAGVFLLLGAVLVSLWQLELVPVPISRFTSQADTQVMAARALADAVSAGDVAAVRAALSNDADVRMRDTDGLTPLMQAAKQREDTLTRLLLAAGSDPNESDVSGMTPLIHAARDGSAAVVRTLLQAGANPTLQDATARSAVDYAAANPALRGTEVITRLESLSDLPFDPSWPSSYSNPIPEATFSSRPSHLPNARRAYRNGFHQGFDFYDGVVSVPISYGMPTVAVADGRVVRVDHEYEELSPEQLQNLLDEAARLGNTPEDTLDLLRGRQVWLEHVGGYVSRYAHLADIASNLEVGSFVREGDIVAYIGNSGTEEAATGTQSLPHLHFELWRGDTFMGEGLEPDAIYERVAQVFGESTLPPFRE